jgi:hypothetical protein
MLRAAEQTALSQGEPLRSEHRLRVAGRATGLLGSLRCWRRAPGPAALAVQRLDGAPERQREAPAAGGAGAARAAAARQRAAAARTGRPGLRDPASGLYAAATSRTSCAARSTCRRASTASSPLVFIEIDPPTRPCGAGRPPRQRVLEAMGRLLRGGTRAMDASCRSTRGASRCCCRAWAWPRRMRAWRACAASAPRRSCARRPGAGLHGGDGRGQLSAHGQRRTSCSRPAKAALAEARGAAATTSRWPASASTRPEPLRGRPRRARGVRASHARCSMWPASRSSSTANRRLSRPRRCGAPRARPAAPSSRWPAR